jgi:hypothetical protein
MLMGHSQGPKSHPQIQRIVRGIATRKRVAEVLEKQRKNQEKGKIRQQNKKKKRKKGKRVV